MNVKYRTETRQTGHTHSLPSKQNLFLEKRKALLSLFFCLFLSVCSSLSIFCCISIVEAMT